MDDFRVSLPEFHGPLDLLLHLVKRNEVDLRDIPVARIAEQFRGYLEILTFIDVELAGEFLVTAATLLEIKSRLLLPRAEEPTESPDADPREELVQQLMEYRKFKEAAARLESAPASGRYDCREVPEISPGEADTPTVQSVELWDLLSAFGRLMQEAEDLAPEQILGDDTPQQTYMNQIVARVKDAGRLEFRELFQPPYYRVRLIGLFLALLELIKGREVLLEQEEGVQLFWILPAQSDVPK